MKINYEKFTQLCKVDDPNNWAPGIIVKPYGVYVVPPPNDVILTPQERSELSWHPTGNYEKPALKFPCSLDELQNFLENAGLYGCIDPFVMAYVIGDQKTKQEAKKSLNADDLDNKLWLIHHPGDPQPEQDWYKAARYFARQLIIQDSTLLKNRNLLAQKVQQSMKNTGITGRSKKTPSDTTILKAFSNVKF